MARKRNKIRYCYEDYIKNCTAEQKAGYRQQFAPLIEILSLAEDDREIMAMAKAYDSEHGTEMFAEAVHLTVYCIACGKFDCDC